MCFIINANIDPTLLPTAAAQVKALPHPTTTVKVNNGENSKDKYDGDSSAASVDNSKLALL